MASPCPNDNEQEVPTTPKRAIEDDEMTCASPSHQKVVLGISPSHGSNSSSSSEQQPPFPREEGKRPPWKGTELVLLSAALWLFASCLIFLVVWAVLRFSAPRTKTEFERLSGEKHLRADEHTVEPASPWDATIVPLTDVPRLPFERLRLASSFSIPAHDGDGFGIVGEFPIITVGRVVLGSGPIPAGELLETPGQEENPHFLGEEGEEVVFVFPYGHSLVVGEDAATLRMGDDSSVHRFDIKTPDERTARAVLQLKELKSPTATSDPQVHEGGEETVMQVKDSQLEEHALPVADHQENSVSLVDVKSLEEVVGQD